LGDGGLGLGCQITGVREIGYLKGTTFMRYGHEALVEAVTKVCYRRFKFLNFSKHRIIN
jgi:hypothetical protein